MNFYTCSLFGYGGWSLVGSDTDTHSRLSRERKSVAGINCLALDFDLTIVDIHTGGTWAGSSTELCAHVRPLFLSLISAALHHSLHLTIVTFSPQVSMIRTVLDEVSE